MRANLTPLLRLLYNPLAAIADIQNRAPYVWGAALAVAASFIYYNSIDGELRVFIAPLLNAAPAPPPPIMMRNLFRLLVDSAAPVLFLAAVFVPACLLAASLIDRRASFRMLLRQEYAPVASCVFYAWASAHLLMLVPALLLFQPGQLSSGPARLAQQLVPLPYFVFLVTLALSAALRLRYARAVAAIAIAALSFLALPLLPTFGLLLSSPFLAILVIYFLVNFFGDVLSAQRSREHFKQSLEIATLNPADASAHYNLGLIYQQRGQMEEAEASFNRAIEIDPYEIDAHYQLGRIARQKSRLADAIRHFDAVATQNPDHSQSEIWREVGRTYFQAGQHGDARIAFERFLQKRPSDAEGRYYYALLLHQMGQGEEAAAQMRAVIESVRTSPAYKYRAEKHWMQQAQSFLRSQSA